MARTILVVDDKSSVTQLLRDYLSEHGFRVVTAKDGREALFTTRYEKPDLVLLDIMMPEMDGYEINYPAASSGVLKELELPIFM